MSLAIVFGSKLCDGFGFSGAGSFGRSGGDSTNFGRTGGSTAASWMASFGGGNCGSGRSGGRGFGSGAVSALGCGVGVGGGVSAFGGVGARAALGGCGGGVGCGGVGSVEARRSGGGVGGAGADCGAGLASFSPLAIWLSSLSETVSIGIASGVSANFGAEATPSRSIASSVPCSAAEPAKFEYDRRSSNAAPGYCLIGSVTSATFLNPAEVTAAMISATRP